MQSFGSRVLFAAILAASTAGTAAFAEAGGEQQRLVLLLHNGQVLEGDVTVGTDFCAVRSAHAEVHIRRDAVQYICHSLREGYLRRRSSVRFGTAEDRLQLAEWCLDNQLMSEAEQELAEARILAPGHPRLAAVKHQIEIARQPLRTIAVKSKSTHDSSDTADLDAMVRGLPEGTVETFTKSVQPLLVNSCSARACHGSAATNDFQIRRVEYGRLPPRRTTLRNLEATLKWVDMERPELSRILLTPAEPHGGKPNAILAAESRPHQNLLAWLNQISGKAEADAAADSLSGIVKANPGQDHGNPVGPNATATSVGAVDDRSGPARPSSANLNRAKDAFDPEIFNRKFGSDGR